MRPVTVILAVAAAAVGGFAKAEPIDTALAAMRKEEKAPLERVRMFVQRGDVIDILYIDRLRPGKTHILRNPQQNGGEAIVIGEKQWLRAGQLWQSSTVPKVPDEMVPSIAGLLEKGLSDATERVQPDRSRLVEGSITWAAASQCNGRLRLRIDDAGLPITLAFDGTCGNIPTRFVEAFSFKGPLRIEAPD